MTLPLLKTISLFYFSTFEIIISQVATDSGIVNNTIKKWNKIFDGIKSFRLAEDEEVSHALEQIQKRRTSPEDIEYGIFYFASLI